MMKLLIFLMFMVPFSAFYSWYMIFTSFMFLFFWGFNSFWAFYFYSTISYGMGGDLLSFSLIFLSVWIVMLMILSSLSLYKSKIYIFDFLMINIFLLIFLVMSFSVSGLFMYYLFFECSLIPTLILIFGWGYQPERLMAGYYLLFYTLFFSLPMLLGIFYISSLCQSTFYFLIDVNLNIFMYFSMVFAFLAKMPMIFIHFWLPKAHVEAPISGSMILAGVLLKLGGYGLLRVYIFMTSFMKFNYLFICLSLFGMFMVGLMCLFQMDMKSLIAYSSVSHMGMVICGIMSMNTWGVIGALVLMIGHGLCSSGMFCLANISYERSGSRSLLVNKGLMTFMPNMSMFWFLLMINNMASPPSLNLLGEILLINGIMSWSTLSCYFLMFSSFISCAYSIYLYSSVNHGLMFSGFMPNSSGYFIEFYLLLLHWLPLNMMVLKVDLISLMV